MVTKSAKFEQRAFKIALYGFILLLFLISNIFLISDTDSVHFELLC